MKRKISKRILVLVLTLVMVVGMLPVTAFAASEAPTWDELGAITYIEGATQYLQYENRLYKIEYSNILDSTRIALIRTGDGESKNLAISSNGLGLLYQANSYKARTEHMPKNPGESLVCYADGGTAGYIVEEGKPVVTITCMAVGDPAWTWEGTSSATAAFTSEDGNATMTVKAAITSAEEPAATCIEKGTVTYTATATANGKKYTDTKTGEGKQGPHSYTYTVAGNTVTETCVHGCGHSAKATLTTPQESYTYTGEPIMAAVRTFDENWQGSKGSYTNYIDNVDVGTATATSDPAGIIITTTFEITAADIADAEITLDHAGADYNGSEQKPTLVVIWKGRHLSENTDYTLSWDKTSLVNVGTYTVTVTGKGNFTGTKEAAYSINPAKIDEAVVTLDNDAFIYNGQPQKPKASVTFEGEVLTEGVDYELYYVNADDVLLIVDNKPVRFFGTGKENSESIDAGQYFAVAFGKGNYADSSFTSAAYTIEKATVAEPTVADKPYNGSVQTADIADSDIYTVVKNDGGIGVKQNGYYDVVLELKDAANYKWSSTDDVRVTVKFAITRATNEWTVVPSVSGWTYGETAKEPVGAAGFGEVSVEYSGTANDGTQFNGLTVPTKAGNYTATFIVAETEDYRGLETSVDFAIAKADYDMSGAKWNYTEAFKYDSIEHKVEVTGLPDGVSVSGYTGNTAADVGSYTAKVSLSYDADNYNAPVMEDLSWNIEDKWGPTENIEKVEDVTADNVTPEDKADLENAKADLEKALADNDGDYSEDEKKAIEEELKRIEDALKVIGNVEAVEEKIGKLPESITKNDEKAIEAADDAYDALSDYEKSLVDEDAIKALCDAKAALENLNKPADPNVPETGDNGNLQLWFALLLTSGAGIVGLGLYDRKRRAANKR